MKKTVTSGKLFLGLVAAIVIAGGAFFATSGMAIADSNSFVASVISSFSGKPTVIISRASASPSGKITNDLGQVLAVFNVKAKNVKWQATLHSFTVSVPITTRAASALTISDFALHYDYCTKQGVYGYGYKGGECAHMAFLEPSSVTRTGDTYTLVFNKDLPIYLAQSSGTLTIVGKPKYTRAGREAVQIRASVSSGVAVGDQCQTIRYGYKNKYGYSKCGNQSATVSVGSAKGNILTVKRPPGYGYPTVATTTPPKPKTTDKR